MSKIKTLYVLLFVAILIISALAFVLFERTNTDFNQLPTASSSNTDTIIRKIPLQFTLFLENEDLKLANTKVYYGSDRAHPFNLFNNTRKGSYLVFRFSGEFCDKCIDALINMLKENFPDYASNDRIILLCSEVTPRLKGSYYGKKMLSYSVENTTLIPFEKTKIPFFYVLDEDRVSKMLFIPQTSQPEITKAYLKIIKQRFFN